MKYQVSFCRRERDIFTSENCWAGATWSSGLRHWIWNLEVPASNSSLYLYLDLFSIVPSSTLWPCCVNNQLVSPPPVGILNSLFYFKHLFNYYVSQISTTVLNTFDIQIKYSLSLSIAFSSSPKRSITVSITMWRSSRVITFGFDR